jgi:DNA-binding HxlR family transcriptional regulator
LNSKVDANLIHSSPVARALRVIGDRWACLIIRDVFLGVRQFEELRRRSGAARGTLTSRLKSLVENEILYRKQYQSSPPRYEYRLTEKGLGLYPFVLAVWAWETRWSHEDHIPPSLTHLSCGNNMRPMFRCGNCHSPITMKEVTFEAGGSGENIEKVPARFQRRSKSAEISDEGVDRRFFHVLDLIGDRWTGLILASAFFGVRRYDEIVAVLGIATNILSDRLKVLVSAEVLQRMPYQDKPVRYEYLLTEKGAALYSNTLQMHEWASHWLLDEGEEPLLLTHSLCQQPLKSELVCSECFEPLTVHEVAFDSKFGHSPTQKTGRNV